MKPDDKADTLAKSKCSRTIMEDDCSNFER